MNFAYSAEAAACYFAKQRFAAKRKSAAKAGQWTNFQTFENWKLNHWLKIEN